MSSTLFQTAVSVANDLPVPPGAAVVSYAVIVTFAVAVGMILGKWGDVASISICTQAQ